ncbi:MULTISPECIES: hypothetical protein [Streptomyces]|uniref:Uncharacterized protein n=1 Tax=Streptomyces galilaeus TaxID=33899 RepID=A0ABW9IXI6_STRGJ
MDLNVATAASGLPPEAPALRLIERPFVRENAFGLWPPGASWVRGVLIGGLPAFAAAFLGRRSGDVVPSVSVISGATAIYSNTAAARLAITDRASPNPDLPLLVVPWRVSWAGGGVG